MTWYLASSSWHLSGLVLRSTLTAYLQGSWAVKQPGLHGWGVTGRDAWKTQVVLGLQTRFLFHLLNGIPSCCAGAMEKVELPGLESVCAASEIALGRGVLTVHKWHCFKGLYCLFGGINLVPMKFVVLWCADSTEVRSGCCVLLWVLQLLSSSRSQVSSLCSSVPTQSVSHIAVP